MQLASASLDPPHPATAAGVLAVAAGAGVWPWAAASSRPAMTADPANFWLRVSAAAGTAPTPDHRRPLRVLARRRAARNRHTA